MKDCPHPKLSIPSADTNCGFRWGSKLVPTTLSPYLWTLLSQTGSSQKEVSICGGRWAALKGVTIWRMWGCERGVMGSSSHFGSSSLLHSDDCMKADAVVKETINSALISCTYTIARGTRMVGMTWCCYTDNFVASIQNTYSFKTNKSARIGSTITTEYQDR